MDAIKQISYTIKDIYNLPEGKRADLYDGSTKHKTSKTYKCFAWENL